MMTSLAGTDLPTAVTRYLEARRTGDVEAATAVLTDDVVVTDEGHDHRGRDAVADWIRGTSKQYTYTVELIGAERIDDDHYVAVQHLEGNFPGGQVDLRFAFTLRDGQIAALTIAP